MESSWYLIDAWLSTPPSMETTVNEWNHILFRKIDEEYLSTIKEMTVKVGDGHAADEDGWRMLRLVYLTPEDLSVLLEVIGNAIGVHNIDARVDARTFTPSEITKIRHVIDCPHCVGDEFWLNQFDLGKYTECDHQSI